MITKITVSLMKKESEIDSSSFKAQYTTRATAAISNIDNQFEGKFPQLVSQMFRDLLDVYKNPKEFDYVGLWVSLDSGEVIDNALEYKSIKDIEASRDDLDPYQEFYKMTYKD
jgi:hypothetical protein